MKYQFLFAAIIASLFIYNGKEDQVGGSERLIANTWKLKKYSVNGKDKTRSLLIRDFTEKIEEFDFYGYSYWYIDANQDTIAQRGSSYRLYANEDSISFYASREIPLTAKDTLTGYRKCKILSLTEDALVYEFRQNGCLHEFQMVRMEE